MGIAGPRSDSGFSRCYESGRPGADFGSGLWCAPRFLLAAQIFSVFVDASQVDSVSSCRNSASGIWFREPSLVSIAPGSEVFSVSALVLACMETAR